MTAKSRGAVRDGSRRPAARSSRVADENLSGSASRDRSADRTRRELPRSSPTARHDFRLATPFSHSAPIFVRKRTSLLRAPPSSSAAIASFSVSSSSSPLPFSSSPSPPPFTSFFRFFFCFVLFRFALFRLLRYFTLALLSRAQFCVLLPPVTLAENNNNAFVPSHWLGSRPAMSSPCPLPLILRLFGL